jgi:hypothetical protein
VKEFTFRLTKAEPDEFWQSVKTANVEEIISSEKHGRYGIEFYQEYNRYVVGLYNPRLLPAEKNLPVVFFELLPIGDGLKVGVDYSDFTAHSSYVTALFQEIAKDWPEARTVIDQVFEPGVAEKDTPYMPDGTDLQIIEIVSKNPSINDVELASQLNPSMERRSAHKRRKLLEAAELIPLREWKLGKKKVSRQNKKVS